MKIEIKLDIDDAYELLFCAFKERNEQISRENYMRAQKFDYIATIISKEIMNTIKPSED